MFGVAPADATVRLRPFDVYRREITVLGSMAVQASFGRAVTLVATRAADLARLVSHTYDLADYPAALATFRSGAGTKVLVCPALGSTGGCEEGRGT